MSDPENPIIDCTVKELCQFAWESKQQKYGRLDCQFASVDDWWAHINATEIPFASIRDAAWQAWRAAAPLNQPNHGDSHHFATWWQVMILDRQPVVTTGESEAKSEAEIATPTDEKAPA